MSRPKTAPDVIGESLLPYDLAAFFKPVGNYALQPLPKAFKDIEITLNHLFKKHKGVEEFDATAFYSRRRSDLTPETIEELAVYNQAAFTAAESAGGLVVYYQGHLLDRRASLNLSPELELNFMPDCLSFCIWESRRQAVAGAGVAAHKKAVAMTGLWYENFALKKYTISTHSAVSGASKSFRDIIFREFQRT